MRRISSSMAARFLETEVFFLGMLGLVRWRAGGNKGGEGKTELRNDLHKKFFSGSRRTRQQQSRGDRPVASTNSDYQSVPISCLLGEWDFMGYPRNGRKNARMSSTRRSGSSMAAKCPPDGITVQRLRL